MGYTANDFIRAAKAMKIEDKGLNNQYRYGETEDLKTEQKYTKHKEICDKLNELYVAKNKEYGDSFGKAFDDIGPVSGVSQIYHKVQRLVSIYSKDERDIAYESVIDNLLDIANYSIMMLIELDED